MKRPVAILCVLAALLGAGLAVGRLGAQQRVDERRLLRALAREFERESRVPDALFAGAAGRLQPGVRCATRPFSDLERDLVDRLLDARLAEAGTSHRERHVRVPVVVHVVHRKNGRWNVSDDRVRRQIAVLDDAFRQHGFRFDLQQIVRHADNRFAKRCLDRGVEKRFKRRHAVDPGNTLNVYTCRPSGGALGYAWFPSDWEADSFMHGVVALHATLPGGTAHPYDDGDTVVHEVGHWLGLYHTFQGGCGGAGDRVDDTPAQRSPTFGCPGSRASCPASLGDDPFDNYMDYSDDACMVRFTEGQRTRMLDQAATFRPKLLQ